MLIQGSLFDATLSWKFFFTTPFLISCRFQCYIMSNILIVVSLALIGKNLNVGFYGYVFWKADNFGKKGVRGLEAWNSLESSSRSCFAEGMSKLKEVMDKVVPGRTTLFFIGPDMQGIFSIP